MLYFHNTSQEIQKFARHYLCNEKLSAGGEAPDPQTILTRGSSPGPSWRHSPQTSNCPLLLFPPNPGCLDKSLIIIIINVWIFSVA